MLLARALMLMAALLSLSAGAVMAGAEVAARRSGTEAAESACRGAVRVLLLASAAVVPATIAAAVLSSGEGSAGGIGPFALAVAVVLLPLLAAARPRHHRRSNRHEVSGPDRSFTRRVG